MRLAGLRNNTAIAFASGFGIAALWYMGSHAIIPGSIGESISLIGTIGLASVVPAFMLRRVKQSKLHQSNLSMFQRLEAMNRHASINIVNEKDELTEVNDKLLVLTGYSREELLGQPVKVLYDVSARDIVGEIRSHLTRGEIWQGETPLLCKDGSTLYTQSTIMPLFDEDGNWAGSISARTDVTQKNQLIAERHIAQTLYELHDDIWIIDSETETFSYMNRSAKERLHVLGEDYRSISVEEFNREHDIEEILKACRALSSNGKGSTQFETKFMGVPADVSIKFLPEAEGDSRYLILFNDISDRIEQEKRKSEFISTVSHELRSPMTSIKGAMGLLLSGSAGELPNKALSLLEIAHRNADRLVLIVNDILDLDKISSGQIDYEIKDVDLAELVSETDQANMLLQQRFGVKVELIGTQVPVRLRTDPNRLIQVLTNLLSNAHKFSRPNSRILIEVQDAADHVRVSVQDEGCGMPLDEQYKVFDRFTDMANSDRAAKGGTGLGLNICKAIIENLGGTIGFETEEGVGSTFYFTLPKALAKGIAIGETGHKRVA